MKATISMTALVMMAAAMPSMAQKDLVDPCIHCDIKDKVIEDLKAQIRGLQAGATEPSTPTAAEIPAVEDPILAAAEELSLEPREPVIPVTTEAPVPDVSPVADAPLPEPVAAAEQPAPEPPAPAPTPEPEPAPVAKPAEFYTVQPGDGLMKIGRVTGHSAEAIAAANGLTLASVIHPGQKLILPGGGGTPANAAPAPAPQPKTYRIKEGDTYYSLSRRLKIPLDELMAANPQAKATQLYEGRIINLPVTASHTPVPAPEPAAAPAPQPAAAPEPEPAASEPPAAAPEAPAEKKVRAIKVTEEISYGDFASKYHTTIERLNALNDLSLTSTTILAKGSELYVPAQP